MQVHDIAVVGSGIGGALISSLNKQKDLILFEKDSNLGGCASTFNKEGYSFNTGATTFVGYEENHPIKRIFNKVGFKPDIKKSEVAIRVIQKEKIVDRIKDFDQFLENINRIYPHKNNYIFWKTIKEIDEKFWLLKDIYFGKYSLNRYIKTFSFVFELLKVYKFSVFSTAKGFIRDIFPDISQEYQNFIDSQLLITLQTTSQNISLLSLSLGLSYPFHDVYYANGGMGKIFDDLLVDINVHKREKIVKIKKEKDNYRLISNKDEYLFKNIILNSTIFDSSNLFEDNDIKNYYSNFSFSDQSAFVVYLKLNIKKEYISHYQIILEKNIPNCISNSFFISFSSIDDEKLSNDGLSITISTHTKATYWKNLSKEQYKIEKLKTQEFIIKKFLENFDTINGENIKYVFSATSKTFNNFINRTNCGGTPITIKNILNTASSNTPFKGLYNIGDTVFAGQGWPGVAIGVEILNKELNNG
jgi:phytoene dehydrogenase-like protein